MKNKIFLKLLVIFMFCSIIPIKSLADDTDTNTLYIYTKDCPEEYITYATNNIGDYLYSPEYANLIDPQLGTPFTFSNSDSNLYYFPIFSENAILYTFRVYKEIDGNLVGILSPVFAKELNSIIPSTSPSNPLKITQVNGKVIFSLKGYEKTVLTFPFTSTQSTASSIITHSDDEFSVKACKPENNIIIDPVTRAASSSYLNLFSDITSITTQKSNNWCAAFSTAAIMTYKGVSTTPETIMKYFYSNPTSDNYLTSTKVLLYAGVNGFKTTYADAPAPSYSQLVEEISSNRPVYLVMTSSESVFESHAIVLRGYENVKATLSVWNPWYNFYETIISLASYVPAQHQSMSFYYTGAIYNWTK